MAVPVESTGPNLCVRGEAEGSSAYVEVQRLEVRKQGGGESEETGGGVHNCAGRSFVAGEGITVVRMGLSQYRTGAHGQFSM